MRTPLSLLVIAVATAAAFQASRASAPTAAPSFAPEVAVAAASERDDVRDRIEDRCAEYLWMLYEERGFPGGSAAVILPNGSEVAIPVGYADVEAEIEMTTDDLMLSGSIGKTYVTAAAHKLMLAGKLSFDQKAIDFFEGEEWFRRVPNGDAVTLTQLLHHQSGIPRYVFKPSFFPDCVASPDKVWTPKELLSYIFDDDPMFAPGKGWAYSDTNFIVIGMIIEKASGMTFYEYVRKNFLDPLGLKATLASDSRRIPGLVQGYVVSFKAFGMPDRALEDGVFCFNPQFEWCGGGFASTPMDLARWARLLYRGEAMEGPYLETMLDSVPAQLGPGKEYGCGVMISDSPFGKQIGHDGVMTGYTATMGYFPDIEVAVALMLNTDNGRVLGMPLDRVTLTLASIAKEELDR